MKHGFSVALVSMALAGVPILVGCDNDKPKAVHESDTKTTNPNTGATSTNKEKTTVDKNGNKTTTTEHQKSDGADTGTTTTDKQKTTVDNNGNKTTTTEHHTDNNGQ